MDSVYKVTLLDDQTHKIIFFNSLSLMTMYYGQVSVITKVLLGDI